MEDRLTIERIGGLAGFGAVGGHLRSRGEVALSTLSDDDRRAIEALFKAREACAAEPVRDGFEYRICRVGASGTDSITVPESMVPWSIVACVRDELA